MLKKKKKLDKARRAFTNSYQDSKRNSQNAMKKTCKEDGENNRTESKIDQDYIDIKVSNNYFLLIHNSWH